MTDILESAPRQSNPPGGFRSVREACSRSGTARKVQRHWMTLRSRGRNAPQRCPGPGIAPADPSAAARVVRALSRIAARLFPFEVRPVRG
jgi:hypothetical protein